MNTDTHDTAIKPLRTPTDTVRLPARPTGTLTIGQRMTAGTTSQQAGTTSLEANTAETATDHPGPGTNTEWPVASTPRPEAIPALV
jgi:hypothetical protein